MTNGEKFRIIMLDLYEDAGGAEAFLSELLHKKVPRRLRKGKKLMVRRTRRYIHRAKEAGIEV
jgi:spermidine synthase